MLHMYYRYLLLPAIQQQLFNFICHCCCSHELHAASRKIIVLNVYDDQGLFHFFCFLLFKSLRKCLRKRQQCHKKEKL